MRACEGGDSQCLIYLFFILIDFETNTDDFLRYHNSHYQIFNKQVIT